MQMHADSSAGCELPEAEQAAEDGLWPAAILAGSHLPAAGR